MRREQSGPDISNPELVCNNKNLTRPQKLDLGVEVYITCKLTSYHEMCGISSKGTQKSNNPLALCMLLLPFHPHRIDYFKYDT